MFFLFADAIACTPKRRACSSVSSTLPTVNCNLPLLFVFSLCLLVQGSDPRSKLRAIRPSVTKVEYEGEPSIQASPVQAAGHVESDLMRNFMTELETLTFFIQANHDDNLLYHYSRVVLRIRPLIALIVNSDANPSKHYIMRTTHT